MSERVGTEEICDMIRYKTIKGILFPISLLLLIVALFAAPTQSQTVSYELILNAENSQVGRGDDLQIYYGVRELVDSESRFIPNVNINFTLEYLNGSETKLIEKWNLTSKDTLASHVISFQYLRNVGQFKLTAFTSFNNTDLNKSIQFEVIVQQLPKVSIIAPSEIFLRPNSTSTIKVTILNLGGITARNLSIEVSVLDSFPAIIVISGLPTEIEKLEPAPLEEVTSTINITTSGFGENILQIVATYSDFDGNTYIQPFTVRMIALPSVWVNLRSSLELIAQQENQIEVEINNFEPTPIQISIEMFSENITFSPNVFTKTLRNNSVSTFITIAKPLISGPMILTIRINLIETIGDQEILIDQYDFPINAIPPPQLKGLDKAWKIITESDTALIPLLIGLGLILFGLFLIDRFYGLRHLIEQLLPLFIPVSRYGMANHPFTYDSKTVVVDGSNVAWEEIDSEGRPKVDNIKRIVELLSSAGFEEIIVLADASLRHQIDKPKELKRLVKLGLVKYLPAKVKGDQLLLRLAEEKDAYILTNDLFKEYRTLYDWIDKRRIPFTIINGEAYLHPTFEKGDTAFKPGQLTTQG